MHCYQYLAAVNAVANSIESLPSAGQKLPYSVVADWMEENGIEPEEILQVSGEEVRAIVEGVIQRDLPQLPNAA